MTSEIAIRPPKRNPLGRSLGWWTMVVLGLFVALYAIAGLAGAPVASPLIVDRIKRVPLALALHLVGGSIAIAIGPFQFNGRLRGRYLGAHRWLGRAYVVAVLIGGLAGLALARISEGGLVTHVGFGLLAVCWVTSTALAWLRIRAGQKESHRIWMIRSYALTFAAVTLRIYLPLSQGAGIPFESAYQAISWFCWVPNLIVAEWLLIGPKAERLTKPAA